MRVVIHTHKMLLRTTMFCYSNIQNLLLRFFVTRF